MAKREGARHLPSSDDRPEARFELEQFIRDRKIRETDPECC